MKKLFNFKHSRAAPCMFNFGPFEIKITQIHCDNLEKLHERETKTFSFEADGTPTHATKSKVAGEMVETATAILKNPSDKTSALFPEFQDPYPYYDLALVLSFLTGRRVYLEEEIGECSTLRYLESAVSDNFFYTPSIDWNEVANLAKKGVSPALHNIIMASCVCDLVGLGLYANASLDLVITQHQKYSYPNKSLVKKCVKDMEISIKNTFSQILQEENIPADITEDLLARITLNPAPSAVWKLRTFLTANQMLPDPPNNDVLDRVKLFNRLRNKLMHSGDILKEQNYTQEESVRISLAITILSVNIVQVYIGSSILRLNDFKLKEKKKAILDFFLTGEFRGQKVFTETYDQYTTRLEVEWENQ